MTRRQLLAARLGFAAIVLIVLAAWRLDAVEAHARRGQSCLAKGGRVTVYCPHVAGTNFAPPWSAWVPGWRP